MHEQLRGCGWARGQSCPTKRLTVLGWREQRRHDAFVGMTLMVLAVLTATVATLASLLG
ncbi:hypothetical protein G6O69_01610 [Pseudenhygromyxa sp. WMMC2535]|uniref:hypothetical protein n=1 Tax=Pseudenhygromyxa sp. WMMC2535 TaxID=2712867 RepID=UPI0015952EFD|nr:hypothetical protein [Pseudenhygromyxa sp. WMMC2535]NVB36510.1 hypothetical protein [Pseudenhygromyxa sp. WMMC2535]